MKKYSYIDFEERANLVHDGKYIYHHDYVDSTTPVAITCPIHGDFKQSPSNHLRGRGCNKCANTKRGRSSNTLSFIEKAESVHGGKYDYSLVKYVKSDKSVTIICPKHGKFEQTPSAHLSGNGCPMCSGKGRTTESIIEEFTGVHGDEYSYDKFVFNGMKKPSVITCRKHGDFLQTPYKHLHGQGCPKCAIERRSEKQRCTQEEFIRRGIEIHGDKDDLSSVKYMSMSDSVTIKCKKHGPYEMRPYDYLQGHRCPKCAVQVSKSEEEIYTFLRVLVGPYMDIKRKDREILGGKEIDIYIPELKIGIEYNGLKWHSEEFGKDRFYHISKLNEAKKKGIRLIQIFEDEYREHKDLVLSKITHILGYSKSLPKIMGRKCVVKEIDKHEAREFLEKNHIQGYSKSTVSLGCFYQDRLIGVMSFIKESEEWNLIRFATDINYRCQGVAGKLFKYFLRKYEPNKIKTFADRRWTTDEENNLYVKLGFSLESVLKPDYRYVYGPNPTHRIHKFNMRKRNMAKKYNIKITEGSTESEMASSLGFYKIYDCGLLKYVYHG